MHRARFAECLLSAALVPPSPTALGPVPHAGSLRPVPSLCPRVPTSPVAANGICCSVSVAPPMTFISGNKTAEVPGASRVLSLVLRALAQIHEPDLRILASLSMGLFWLFFLLSLLNAADTIAPSALPALVGDTTEYPANAALFNQHSTQVHVSLLLHDDFDLHTSL